MALLTEFLLRLSLHGGGDGDRAAAVGDERVLSQSFVRDSGTVGARSDL